MKTSVDDSLSFHFWSGRRLLWFATNFKFVCWTCLKCKQRWTTINLNLPRVPELKVHSAEFYHLWGSLMQDFMIRRKSPRWFDWVITPSWLSTKRVWEMRNKWWKETRKVQSVEKSESCRCRRWFHDGKVSRFELPPACWTKASIDFGGLKKFYCFKFTSKHALVLHAGIEPYITSFTQ